MTETKEETDMTVVIKDPRSILLKPPLCIPNLFEEGMVTQGNLGALLLDRERLTTALELNNRAKLQLNPHDGNLIWHLVHETAPKSEDASWSMAYKPLGSTESSMDPKIARQQIMGRIRTLLRSIDDFCESYLSWDIPPNLSSLIRGGEQMDDLITIKTSEMRLMDLLEIAILAELSGLQTRFRYSQKEFSSVRFGLSIIVPEQEESRYIFLPLVGGISISSSKASPAAAPAPAPSPVHGTKKESHGELRWHMRSRVEPGIDRAEEYSMYQFNSHARRDLLYGYLNNIL